MIGGGGSRYRPDDRYGGSGGGSGGIYPTRRIPPRYPTGPSRYPMDNSIGGGGGGGDLGSRYYPENRYPDARPDRYPADSDRGYYPATVTGTRYPTSDNRFPVGNDRSPIFILKYGNRYGGSGNSLQITQTTQTHVCSLPTGTKCSALDQTITPHIRNHLLILCICRFQFDSV